MVELRRVAEGAIGWRTCISRCVTFDAFQCGMPASQRECRAVMVENEIRITRRVASKTCRAAVRIAVHAVVFVVGLWVGAAGSASEFRIIGRNGMAVNTFIPFAFVFSTINRKVLPVVVKGGW